MSKYIAPRGNRVRTSDGEYLYDMSAKIVLRVAGDSVYTTEFASGHFRG